MCSLREAVSEGGTGISGEGRGTPARVCVFVAPAPVRLVSQPDSLISEAKRERVAGRPSEE